MENGEVRNYFGVLFLMIFVSACSVPAAITPAAQAPVASASIAGITSQYRQAIQQHISQGNIPGLAIAGLLLALPYWPVYP